MLDDEGFQFLIGRLQTDEFAVWPVDGYSVSIPHR